MTTATSPAPPGRWMATGTRSKRRRTSARIRPVRRCPERRDRARSMRRTRAAAALWVAAALIAGCAAPAATAPRDDPSDVPLATTTVRRQDLVARDDLDGTLGYRGGVPLVAGRDGVLTWMPSAGTVVRRGDVVAEIDGVATRLL